MTKPETLDCVAVKRRAQRALANALAGKSPDEQVEILRSSTAWPLRRRSGRASRRHLPSDPRGPRAGNGARRGSQERTDHPTTVDVPATGVRQPRSWASTARPCGTRSRSSGSSRRLRASWQSTRRRTPARWISGAEGGMEVRSSYLPCRAFPRRPPSRPTDVGSWGHSRAILRNSCRASSRSPAWLIASIALFRRGRRVDLKSGLK